MVTSGNESPFNLADYAEIFHNISEGIFIHPPDSDEILEVNDRLTEMLGYSRSELLEMTVGDITADEWNPPIEPETQVKQARTEGQVTFEWRDQRKDGTELWVEVSLTLITLHEDEYVLASVRDISERKETERRIRAIFDQTYQFTGLMEPDGTLIEANQTALEFGGLDSEDVIGKKVWNTSWFAFSEETQAAAREAVQRASNGEFVRENLEVHGANGTEMIDFSVRPITDEQGTVTLLIPEGRVITELVEQRQYLDVYNRVMRHNLRNKLNVINGLTQEIREVTANESIEEYADRILDVSNRIDEITEQIRELDRLREETDVSNPVDIEELLDRIVASSSTEETTVRLQCEDGLVVEVNETLLALVIEQLLENAVKHGGDTVTLSASETTDPEPGIVFVVDDNGPGISPDEYKPVLDRTATQLNHSTGIGLLIIRWGIDELGGELDFESGTDGTTAKFWVPAHACHS